LLISMTEEAHDVCDVCYRSKVNRERCFEHKTTGSEPPELRWARKIMDDYLLRYELLQTECQVFHPQLVFEPIQFLNGLSAQHPSLDSTLEQSFQQLNSYLPNDSKMNFELVNDRIRDRFSVLSRELAAFRPLLLRPLDEKWNQLFAIMVWEYVNFSSQQQFAAKWVNHLNLKLFIKLWFKGFSGLAPNPTKEDGTVPRMKNTSSMGISNTTQLKILLSDNQFDWLRKGFDPYSKVVQQIDALCLDEATNFHIVMHQFMHYLIRQSAWVHVDYLFKNNPDTPKIEHDKVLELYQSKDNLSFSEIGIQLSPENPLSKDVVRTTLGRIQAKKITSEVLKQGIVKLSATHKIDVNHLSKMDVPTKKALGQAIAELINLEKPVLAGAVSIAIKKYLLRVS
jgi:hypothetical protein